VTTAPSGAANEKMRSRRLIWGGVRLRDMRVVVRPRAVGPIRQPMSSRVMNSPLWTKTARNTTSPRLPFPLRLLAPNAIPSAAP